MSLGRLCPAAFLDRDGVLILDKGYVFKPQDLDWVAGAPAAVAALNRAGYLVIVVTNQSGVARGLFAEADVRAFHDHMSAELAKLGAHIDAFYYCPHHPAGAVSAYRRTCDCRKPGPGMIVRALRDFPIDRSRSFLIGDKDTDLTAAKAAGIHGHLFTGSDLASFVSTAIAGEGR